MRRLRKSLSVVLIGLAIAVMGAGCSSTTGLIGHGIGAAVQLDKANFDVIKSVTGEAKADYLFGIGLSSPDLLGSAKRNMLAQAELTGSQAVVNVTIDIKVTEFIIWSQKKVFISGEVVQFK